MEKNNKILNLIKKLKPKTGIIIAIIIVIIIILSIIISVVIISNKTKQKYVLYTGDNLNEEKYPGYKNLIDDLKDRHPNWNFTLFYTKLDWNDVIANEGHSDDRANSLNLIPDYMDYPENWVCEIDKDKTYDNGHWLCASNIAIANQMDPRNILNEEKIFQFKELNYTEGAYTIEGIKNLTDNTFLDGDSLAEALIQASKNVNLDPYFVTSRLIQEQGRDGTTLSRGYEYNGTIVYNPFNIKASGNSSEEILENAAKYAYQQGWDSLEKALLGGIDFVKESYINVGQSTLYLQKFDVVNYNNDKDLYTHQYMQNLFAPESEANNMKSIYEQSNSIDCNYNFIIPLYENMM